MRRRSAAVAGASLLVAGAVAAIVLAVGGGGGPSRSTAANCHAPAVTAVHAAVPATLLASLPVLARKPRPGDTPPRRGIAQLSYGIGTGLDPHAARLIRSDATGRAWVVPLVHDAPQVPSETLACIRAEVRESDRIALHSPTAAERSMIARTAAIDRLNARRAAHAPPGVLIYTQGKVMQTGSATLPQLRSGAAFTTGECTGPGHNLLTVSGLAPAPTAKVEVDLADGSSQTQRVPAGAYSFLLAPTPLPERLVLRDASGRALHTLAIPAGRFALRAHCTFPSAGPPEIVPAGYTVIAFAPRGPYGYLIAVSSSGNPGCAPNVTEFSRETITAGAATICRSWLPAPSLVPTFGGGSAGPQRAAIDGQVSARVRQLRLTARDGRSLTVPVYAAPEWISHDYGIVFAVGPSDVITANPLVEALGADGTILSRSHALRRLQHAGRGYPVTQLPPGNVTLATLATRDGAASFTLHRIRYFGHVSLCIATTFGTGNSQTCANYPVGPKSNQGIGNAPLWLVDAGPGSCRKPPLHVVAGILLHPGLSAWLRTPQGTRRMRSVAIPKAFDVAGPLVYAPIASGSDTIVVHNGSGATVYTRPALTGVSFGACLHRVFP